jgi:hypothetical protein
MSFSSNLGGSVIIDDSNADKYIQQVQDENQPFAGGYDGRDFDKYAISQPFTSDIIPRSDLPDIIQEREERGITLADLHAKMKIPVLNQGSLPYCWCYGVVGAMQVSYAQQGGYVPHLSATSAAAKGKNYVKRGGWGEEALRYIERFGVSTVEHWPEAQLSSRFDTAEQRENAALHKVTPRVGFEELPSNDFDALATALLKGWPVTMGLNWWGHLVFALRPVIIERGSFGIEIMNSWGERWENRGKAVLRYERSLAAEQIVIKNVTPVAQAA